MMYSLPSRRSAHHTQLQAFTLIELVVVVAIIALLVAILLPSLNQAREIAEQAVCGSKTHQWALAFVLYDRDNGTLPCVSSDSLEVSFTYTIGPYVGYNYDDYAWGHLTQGDPSDFPPFWQCPSAPDMPKAYGQNYPNIIGYVNQDHRPSPWAHRPFSISEFSRPSETIVLGDVHRRAIYPPYGLPTYAPYFSHWRPDMDWDGDGVFDTNTELYNWFIAYALEEIPYNAIAPRHGDRMANMVFLDGHAGPMHINDLVDENRRLWGNDVWE